MTFIQNLWRKIDIQRLAQKVVASIGPPDSGRKTDRSGMRQLLEMAAYTYERHRDLDLFIDRTSDPDCQTIVVLDNELAMYRTTATDVALRKSPTLKEMLNLGNIIKILNDRSVVVSKREDSVLAVEAQCLATLDLNYTPSDLDDMVQDGVASLAREMTDGVLDGLTLWSTLLGWKPAPPEFQHRQQAIVGAIGPGSGKSLVFGPAAAYAINQNRLVWIDAIFSGSQNADIRRWRQLIAGKLPPDAEGADVFQAFKALAMTSRNP